MEKTIRRRDYRWVMTVTIVMVLVCVTFAGAADCSAGCSCLPPSDVMVKKMTLCEGKETLCGSGLTPDVMYCYSSESELTSQVMVVTTETAAPRVAVFTCPSGYECRTDAAALAMTGNQVRFSNDICGYEPSPAAPNGVPRFCYRQETAVTPTIPLSGVNCTYDPKKNACTGTCKSGSSCAVSGRTVDPVTGRETVACGCTAAGCAFDSGSGTCIGTCKGTGQSCLMTAISKDSAGKIIAAECQCNTAERITAARAPFETCTPGPGNTCSDQSPGISAVQKAGPQDIANTLGNFFRSLFGWK